jgi:hypothetical protein
MQLDVDMTAAFLSKIAGLGFAPIRRVSPGWRLKEREVGRISWFPEELVSWDDWGEGVSRRRDEILALPETVRLVDHVHEVTGAELPYIRGAVGHVAEAFLRNASMERAELVQQLAIEVHDLFSNGLPVTFKSFLTGIVASESFAPAPEVTIRPFEFSDWPAWLSPGMDFGFPGLTDCTIFDLKARFEPLGQPFDPFDPAGYHWQKAHEKVLRILRLYRVGGVQSQRMLSVQTTLVRLPLHGQQSSGSRMTSMFGYKLAANDRNRLAAHFEFLKDLPPWKISELTPVDVALERYEAAISPGRNVEEILLYAILGIEALFRQRETNRHPFVRRVGRLLELADLGNAAEIEEAVGRAYEYRNPFVHGEMLPPAQVADVQSRLGLLLDYLRLSVLLFIGLQRPKNAVLQDLDAVSKHRTPSQLVTRLKGLTTGLELQLGPQTTT